MLKISATIASAGGEGVIAKMIKNISDDIKENGKVESKDLKKDVQEKLDKWDEIVADVKDAEKKMAESSDSKDVEEKKDEPSSSGTEEPIVVEPVAQEPISWIGASGKNSFDTGVDNDCGTSGIWFVASDFEDGGESSVEMVGTDPSETYVVTFDYDQEVPNSVVEKCQGVCGTFTLNQGRMVMEDPYIKAYFNVAGADLDEDGNVCTTDANDWGGICVTYKSSVALKIELYSRIEYNRAVAWDVPVYQLQESPTNEVEKCLAWSDFKQEGWGPTDGGVTMSSEDFVKNLGSVVIKFKSSTSGLTGDFSITKLTSYTIKTRQ